MKDDASSSLRVYHILDGKREFRYSEGQEGLGEGCSQCMWGNGSGRLEDARGACYSIGAQSLDQNTVSIV